MSLIYRNRAVPIHIQVLDQLGNSNYDEQTAFLEPVLRLLEDYTVVLLGDRMLLDPEKQDANIADIVLLPLACRLKLWRSLACLFGI